MLVALKDKTLYIALICGLNDATSKLYTHLQMPSREKGYSEAHF